MVSLEFCFDEDKVRSMGYTTDDLLESMRKHAAKYGIKEERYGFFTMDGENALAAIGMYVIDISRNNLALLDYLTKLEMIVGDEVDDCIKDIKRWQNKRAVA